MAKSYQVGAINSEQLGFVLTLLLTYTELSCPHEQQGFRAKQEDYKGEFECTVDPGRVGDVQQDPGNYEQYASVRTVIPSAVVGTVDELRKAGVKKESILQFILDRTDRNMTIRDVHNLVRRLKEREDASMPNSQRLKSWMMPQLRQGMSIDTKSPSSDPYGSPPPPSVHKAVIYGRDPFEVYLRKNWDSCKPMWCAFEHQNAVTLGNNTNNRLESSWKQQKDTMYSFMGLDECVASMMCYQSRNERRFVARISTIGMVVNAKFDREMSLVANLVSDHACELIFEHSVPRTWRTSRRWDDTDVTVVVDAAVDDTGVAEEIIPAPDTGFDPVEVDQEEGDEQVTPADSSGLSAVELQVLETFDTEISTQQSVVGKCPSEVGNIPQMGFIVQSQMGTNPSDSSDRSDAPSRPPDDENRSADEVLHGPHVPDLGSHPVRLRDDDDLRFRHLLDLKDGRRKSQKLLRRRGTWQSPWQRRTPRCTTIAIERVKLPPTKSVLQDDDLVRVLPKEILRKCDAKVSALQHSRKGLAERDVVVEIPGIGVFFTDTLGVMRRYHRAITAVRQVESAEKWVATVTFNIAIEASFRVVEGESLPAELRNLKLQSSERLDDGTLLNKLFGADPSIIVASPNIVSVSVSEEVTTDAEGLEAIFFGTSSERVIIPVNGNGNHRSSIMIDLGAKHIYFYDPMKSKYKLGVRAVAHHIAVRISGWRQHQYRFLGYTPDLGIQTDSYNCGIYVVVACEIFAGTASPGYVDKRTLHILGGAEAQVHGLPPQSPDLNPIENLWSIMKAALQETPATDLDDLREKLATIWYKIPVGIVQKLIYSMSARLEAVRKEKGGCTRW
ncbi:unnamed protein product [Phytophthora fragariaefolia]|uniref:Unnamed protein product n=1 Tax=Phytophthora fragariaefolia TaxID=1490495 RepID=A0A9W6TSH8_9STRA|nr:unnamed protein product [Phytophthora fragariaefolia]